MTAPDHLRITGPEDILGFIPHSLGYWPARSLVAMTMQGKRLGATLRVDLPGDGGSPDWSGTPGPAGFARSVASYLEADAEADGSLLAFFTEADGDGAPWAELLAALEDTLADAGMPVRDAWLVGADYWRNAYCLDPSCCAPPGRPVEEIRNSRLNAEMVYRGSTVGAAPGDALLSPPPGEPDPAVLEAQLVWAQLFSAHVRDREQFGQVLDVWARVLQAHAPVLSTALTGYLRACLCVPSWRDAVLVMAAAGPEAAERGAEDFGVFDGGTPHPGRDGSLVIPGPLRATCSVAAAGRLPAPRPGLRGQGRRTEGKRTRRQRARRLGGQGRRAKGRHPECPPGAAGRSRLRRGPAGAGAPAAGLGFDGPPGPGAGAAGRRRR